MINDGGRGREARGESRWREARFDADARVTLDANSGCRRRLGCESESPAPPLLAPRASPLVPCFSRLLPRQSPSSSASLRLAMQRQVSRCCSTHSHLLHHECRRGREADACLVLDVSSLPRGLCLQGTDARRVAVAQVHGDWGSVAADHVDGGRLWTGVVAVPQIRRLCHQRQLRRQLRQRVIREAGTWRQLRVQSVLRGRRRGERSRGSRAGGSGRATHDQLDGDCRHRRRHQVSRRWMACRRHLLGKGYASSPFLPFFPSSLLPPSPLFARPAILSSDCDASSGSRLSPSFPHFLCLDSTLRHSNARFPCSFIVRHASIVLTRVHAGTRVLGFT